MESKTELRSLYTYIFIYFYFIEGFVQGMPLVFLPVYLADLLGGSYDIAQWLIIAFIGSLPWAIKLIIGIFSDKWETKKFGKFFPWIAGFGIYGGIWWFVMAAYMPADDTVYTFLALYNLMTQLGMAFSDTALDGLLLDVTPKKKLGKLQGYTWTFMLLGIGAGNMLLGLIFLAFNAVPLLFLLTGILTIISSLTPYFIKSQHRSHLKMKKMGEEILSFFTRIKNWKVYLYAFTGSITGVALLTFFNYLILISIGVINVEETLLSIRTGTAVDLLGWNSIFLLVNGIGTGIGSLLSGKFADKSRRKTTSINYLIYIPLTILSVFPFFIFQEYLLALIFGIIGQILFGAIEGALGISNTTIRGDISKKEYPNLKATYFALLISCNNMGQSFGNLMGAWIMGFFVLIIPNFYTLYLILSIFCTITLIVSFFSFRLIDPKDYEFSHLFENVKEK